MENETQTNELPNPADFMQLGEDAYNKNVHEKLRETLSANEKQMWISGYLLALTEQNKQIKIVKDQRDKMFQKLIQINGKLSCDKFIDYKGQESFSEYIMDFIKEYTFLYIKKENTAESIDITQAIKETETNSILEKIPTFPLSVASGGQTASIFNVTSGTEFTSTASTSTFNQWSIPKRVEVNEFGETIEMIYKQTSCFSRTGGLTPYHDERAVKIIYSCVNGKWNKSEPIYGKIIPSQNEYFEFEN